MPQPAALAPVVAEVRFTVALAGPVGAVGSFQECTGMGVRMRTKEYREGGNNLFVHRLPDGADHDNVVLKRGVTNVPALFQWMTLTTTAGVQLATVTITLTAIGGMPMGGWALTGAWPVKWTGPNLNAASGQVATESLEIAFAQLTVA